MDAKKPADISLNQAKQQQKKAKQQS
jgi:hypothetical protein